MSVSVPVSPVRQACAKDDRDGSKLETETKLRGECMRDLQAAAAVLAAAVATVAAAAERRAPQHPSDRLLAACCTAVYALTGRWLLHQSALVMCSLQICTTCNMCWPCQGALLPIATAVCSGVSLSILMVAGTELVTARILQI